jgi:hypothetical protein
MISQRSKIDPHGPLIDWFVPGRAFVYDEAGEVEYFLRFEDGKVRSVCGGLRNVFQCRPLEYVMDLKYCSERYYLEGHWKDPGRA